MLRMRPEQLQVFQPVAETNFVNRIVDHLTAKHAAVVVRLGQQSTTVKQLPTEVLQGLVRQGIARARAYGLTWESSVGGFVVILFVAAPNFDAHPLVRRVLKDERVPADLRVKHLWHRTTAKTWAKVRERYDPAAWRKES
jgi:hypothetical protein